MLLLIWLSGSQPNDVDDVFLLFSSLVALCGAFHYDP